MSSMLRLLMLIASIAVVACAAPVGETEGEVGETGAPLRFEQGDPDPNWSGEVRYDAGWAQRSFDAYPGLYLYDDGKLVHGSIYLSTYAYCFFRSYRDADGRITIQSDLCESEFDGLQARLDCIEASTGDLSCQGRLQTSDGLSSNLSGTLVAGIVCAPDGCYEGPVRPMPPGPRGPADCNPGEKPCAGGCCLSFERCGGGGCWIPTDDVPERAPKTDTADGK